ncbi:hypothetical protein OF83DRAFT_863564 [Amylostereum chailletii]|nr:hypothetical protein OF83DRAFT_863564 [Amylostereum chailletii]
MMMMMMHDDRGTVSAPTPSRFDARRSHPKRSDPLSRRAPSPFRPRHPMAPGARYPAPRPSSFPTAPFLLLAVAVRKMNSKNKIPACFESEAPKRIDAASGNRLCEDSRAP